MYNAKRILNFCAKVRRFSYEDSLKVTSVECFSLVIGETITLCLEAPSFGFSLATIYNASTEAGIHLRDIAAYYNSNTQCVWHVTFFSCKTGTASKLKSFFKL